MELKSRRDWSLGTCQNPSCGKEGVAVTLIVPSGPHGRALRELRWLLVCNECLEKRDRGELAPV
jgi:hypothetical protein